jgi:hypothetical protein
LSEGFTIQRESWWRTLLLISVLLIAGCQKDEVHIPDTGAIEVSSIPTATMEISPTQAPIIITPDVPKRERQVASMAQDDWKDLPVLPDISLRVKEIYERGLSLGNNPRVFAKVGDCGSSISWFLGPFDEGPGYYSLGDHTYLQPLVENFAGSFGRNSVAARNGFTASSVFAPLWSDQNQCWPGEGPLACEYRVSKPSFSFIMLGTNDRWHMDTFEDNMRQIIEYSIEQGVVPILGTKADNYEEDESINRTISRLALEYEVPLWNYWLAVQPLPNHGLVKDGVHLTWGPVRFDDPENLKMAWPVRNLTAMQTLELVWTSVTDTN